MFLRPSNYQGVPATQPNGASFAIPPLGGALAVRYGNYVWADGTAGTVMRLPQGAVPVHFEAIVSQSFDGGTQSVRIGDTTTSNRWASTVDTGTAAYVTSSFVGSQLGPFVGSLTEDTYVIVARNAAAGGSATQGTLSIVCYYAML